MLKIFRTIAIIIGLSNPVSAEIVRPDNPLQTLRILEEAIHAAAPNVLITVDEKDISFRIELQDGAYITGSPYNLHIQLQDAANEAERDAFVKAHVRALLETIAGASDPNASSIDLNNVLPVIRPAEFFTDYPDLSFPLEQFPGGLVVYWVIDGTSHTESVNSDKLAATSLDKTTLADLALENLRIRMKGLVHRDLGGVTLLLLDNNYEASALLLPEMWTEMWTEIDTRIGTVVVAVIARDLVIYGDGDDPEIVAAMRKIAVDHFQTSAYAISSDLFRWDAGRWEVLP